MGYDRSEFPYQFPECAPVDQCSSCGMSSDETTLQESFGALAWQSLGELTAVAWASAVSSNSHPTLKDDPLPQVSNFLDSIEDGLEGKDTKGVHHGEMATTMLTSRMSIGSQFFQA